MRKSHLFSSFYQHCSVIKYYFYCVIHLLNGSYATSLAIINQLPFNFLILLEIIIIS